MLDSAVLQVLIGLALVFAVFSVTVSRVNEAVLGFLNYRGRQLEAELRRLTTGATRPGRVEPQRILSSQPAEPTTIVAANGAPPPAQTRPYEGAAPGRDVTAELMDGPLRAMRTGGGPAVPPVAARPPAQSWLGDVRRARDLRLPPYVASTAFARAVLDLVEPPPRALLAKVRPAEMTDQFPDTMTAEQRDAYARAYRAAYEALTPATAAALHEATPAQCEQPRSVTTAMVTLLAADAAPAAAPGGPDIAPLLPLAAEIARLPESPLKTALIAISARAGADRDTMLAELAQWYDTSMDRLSGWYKRQIGRFLLGYALVLTLAFNLDAVSLTRAFWQDSAVRAAALSAAEYRSASQPAPATSPPDAAFDESLVQAVRDVGALQIPFGWTGSDAATDPRAVPGDATGWLLKVLGWLVAVGALTAGAPFWFDLLGRLVNMRSTGPKPKAADG